MYSVLSNFACGLLVCVVAVCQIKTAIESIRTAKKLVIATRRGNASKVRSLLEAGHDVNEADNDGNTALICAASNGNLDLTRMLLGHSQIWVNQENNRRRTALMEAVRKGHVEVVRTLIGNSQLDIDPSDRWGNTPLMEAAESGNIEIVRILLTHPEIQISAMNDRGQTAEDLVQVGNQEIANLLKAKAKAFDLTD